MHRLGSLSSSSRAGWQLSHQSPLRAFASSDVPPAGARRPPVAMPLSEEPPPAEQPTGYGGGADELRPDEAESAAMYTVRVLERERAVARAWLERESGWAETRIVQLLPGVPWPPAVEPALPPSWTCMAVSDAVHAPLIWGTRADLERLQSQDLTALVPPPTGTDPPPAPAQPDGVAVHTQGPVLAVRQSEVVRQISATQLDVEAELMAHADSSGRVALSERHSLQVRRLAWGPHCPGLALATHEAGAGCVRLALLLGLNAPMGEVLELVLVPGRPDSPPDERPAGSFSPAELRLWEALVTQTRPLPNSLAARLRGVLAAPGRVLFAPLHSDVQVLLRAEQRASDRAVQLLITATDLSTPVEVGSVVVRTATAAPSDYLAPPGSPVVEVALSMRRPGSAAMAGSLLIPLPPPRTAFSVTASRLQLSPHVHVRELSADEQRRTREALFRAQIDGTPEQAPAPEPEPPQRPPPADQVGRLLHNLSYRLRK